jgi:hypothetical protein
MPPQEPSLASSSLDGSMPLPVIHHGHTSADHRDLSPLPHPLLLPARCHHYGGLWLALASVSPWTENAGMSEGRHEPKGVFIGRVSLSEPHRGRRYLVDTARYLLERIAHEEEPSVYATRRMMWTPLSLSTSALSWPTLSANAASSNGGVILPRPNTPRSPPRLALCPHTAR